MVSEPEGHADLQFVGENGCRPDWGPAAGQIALVGDRFAMLNSVAAQPKAAKVRSEGMQTMLN